MSSRLIDTPYVGDNTLKREMMELQYKHVSDLFYTNQHKSTIVVTNGDGEKLGWIEKHVFGEKNGHTRFIAHPKAHPTRDGQMFYTFEEASAHLVFKYKEYKKAA